MSDDDVRPITLQRFPLRLSVRSRAHFEELVREFQLLEIGRQRSDAAQRPVPARLIELVETLTHRFASRVEAIEAQRAAALNRGESEMDLSYDAPVAARESLLEVGALLEECDAYCRSDNYLLTLETAAEIREFRRWNIGEIVRQIDCEQPTPWTGEL